MRVLYLTQYFPPEIGATQTRAYEMASNFTQHNTRTTIITEFPNHPSGIIPKQYRGKIYERVEMDGIDVIRVWVKASPNKTFRSRMAFYLSYMINATILGGLLARGDYDIVYCTSPPLFVGGAGLILTSLKRTKLVFEVRDLWPESAVVVGELSNPTAIRLATHLEELCYRKAKKIIVVTQGICDRLVERGIPKEKITIIPNGSNIELFHFNPQHRDEIRRQYHLNNKFVLIYAGIFGVAQGLESVIEAARYLQEDTTIHFLLIGNGPKKKDIVQLAERYALENVTILPEQPRNIISRYLSAADIALVPLKNLEIFRGALPSKIFDAWACRLPVLIGIDGEARHLVEEVKGGVYTPPESTVNLVRVIQEIKNSPESLVQMGENGLAFTSKHYSRQVLADKLHAILKEIAHEE